MYEEVKITRGQGNCEHVIRFDIMYEMIIDFPWAVNYIIFIKTDLNNGRKRKII